MTQLALVCDDFYHYTTRMPDEWDLIIGHAVLDLFDLDTALRRLANVTRPGGLLYLTINYDGHTIFEPQIAPAFEEQLLRLYNRSMDERLVNGLHSGDSQTGRHLFMHIKQAGLEILAAGSSDWVVFSGSTGYPEDEGDFLTYLVETIYRQMKGHPAMGDAELDRWVAARKDQIGSGELVCIVHQLDFLVRK